MTYLEFISECNMRTIDEAIALENDKVRQALSEGDDGLVLRLLDLEF